MLQDILAASHGVATQKRQGPRIGSLNELPGCAADGPTYQETILNVQVIIDEWAETAKVLGRPVPEPKGRRPS